MLLDDKVFAVDSLGVLRWVPCMMLALDEADEFGKVERLGDWSRFLASAKNAVSAL